MPSTVKTSFTPKKATSANPSKSDLSPNRATDRRAFQIRVLKLLFPRQQKKMTKIFDNLDPDLFRTYAFWSTVLVLKMFAVALQTSRMRFKKKVSAFYGL